MLPYARLPIAGLRNLENIELLIQQTDVHGHGNINLN